MTDRLLNDQLVEQIREAFQKLQHPVEILFFGSKEGCEYCPDTLNLVQEITEISGLLSLKTYDLVDDAEIAGKFKVDKAPGLVLAGKGPVNTGASLLDAGHGGGDIWDFGVRYAGVPSGYEFSSLIQDIILVSGRDSMLSQETRSFLKELKEPVLLQVFVTPT
jgi:alkyl hydroperoxide reductase subunit AhpF